MIEKLKTRLGNIREARLIDAGLDDQFQEILAVIIKAESGKQVSPNEIKKTLENMNTARLMLFEISKRVKGDPELLKAVDDILKIVYTLEMRLKGDY